MRTEEDFDQEIEHTKKRAKGCLTWFAILGLGPMILFIGIFAYEMNLKETALVISHSPNNINTLKVVEKGQAAWFGPSSVRIKYGWKHIDRNISNDGATLKPANVSITWKHDNEATIILYGDEQFPEKITFKAKEKSNMFVNKNNSDSEPFQTGQHELGSFNFLTSESPNKINIIEFREVTMSKGSGPNSTVRIYYGERGSTLEKYKEYMPSAMYTPDNFKVDWQNDQQVKIAVIRENEEGERFVEKTIEIDFAK